MVRARCTKINWCTLPESFSLYHQSGSTEWCISMKRPSVSGLIRKGQNYQFEQKPIQHEKRHFKTIQTNRLNMQCEFSRSTPSVLNPAWRNPIWHTRLDLLQQRAVHQCARCFTPGASVWQSHKCVLRVTILPKIEDTKGTEWHDLHISLRKIL